MKSHSSVPTTPTTKRDALEEFLEEKLREATAYRFAPMGLLDVLKNDPENIRSQASSILRQMSSGLEELIISDPRFFGSTVKMIRAFSGASVFYPNFVGPKLLERTFATGSASSAIAWLQKILSTRVADGKFITALRNVPVDSEVQLTPDFRLVPYKSLPHSGLMTSIWESHLQKRNLLFSFAFHPLTSALVAPYQEANFLYDREERPGIDGRCFALHESAQDITLLLTLIGPRVVINEADWFDFDDPDLELSLPAQSHSRPMMEILPKVTGQKLPVLNGEEAMEIIRRFNALAPNAKEKIRIATDRLRRALLRHQPADMAVEVSIALEILCGDTQPSEMTHKVKVRAVRLLGGTPSVRERNRTIVTKTYDVRSKLVHQGIHETKPILVLGVSMEVDAVISEACHQCAELIKTIIRRGSFPDWSHFDINDHGSTLSEAPP